jgi:hypothetical protein
MSKVYGLHEIELRPGVRSEDFEKFVIEEVSLAPSFPGWETIVLRGNRGERDGKYMLMFVIDNVESRDRFYPGPGQASGEVQKFMDSRPEFGQMVEKWKMYATFPDEETNPTDYQVVAGS